jgi:cell division protein FtsQ
MATKQTKKRDKKRKVWRCVLRGLLVVLGVLGMGSVSVLGWHWMTALRCERIELHGLHLADSTALLHLAQVDTGMVLIDIDPALVADRVQRHPWVETARATRLPTGTLTISVQERNPVVLVLGRRGAPGYFLDRAGFAMPPAPEAVYDVPLLRGLDRPRDRAAFVVPLQDERVRDLLGALADADDETDALVSELDIEPSGEVVLHTTPVGARGSIPVRLGRDGFAEKLARLRAFWHQAVLPQPDRNFASIDLRFDSQIVTREADE